MKKNRIKLLILFIIALVILSCAKEPNIDINNSRDTVEWAGYYQGVIPKDDNQGTYTDIELKEDLTFIKRTKKVGQEEKLMTINGTFSWSKDGNSILLESDYESNSSTLIVQENRLVWKNIQAREIAENERENFVLTKIPGILMEKKWVIKKISDTTINIIPKDENDQIYIFFASDENKVYGFGGCNFFRAYYHLVDNEISFTPVISTKMAGPNIAIENRFFSALKEIKKYEIVGNELYFMNENGLHLMAAVARNEKK